MKKTFIFILMVLTLAGLSACSQKLSAIEKLRLAQPDPVEAMRLPEREKTGRDGGPEAAEKSPDDDLDLSTLKSMESPNVQKYVVISSNQIPLRKGPGPKFDKVKTAKKDDTLKLLRTIPGKDKQPAWHLVESEDKEKLFVSSLFTKVIEKEILPPRKVSLKQADPISPDRIRSVIRTEPKLPEELKSAKHITLNFDGTDVYDVITTFCELLQIDYLIEGDVSGKITLQTFSKVPAKDLYSILEQILAVNNITVVKTGNFYRFMPIKDAVRKPLSLYYGRDSYIPAEDRMVIHIIPLKHLTPESMKKVITPILSQQATLLDIPETNNLMLIELGRNVRRIAKVIRALDVDKLAASEIHLYRVTHSNAEEVVEELKEIFSSIGYGNALDKSLTFLPINRLNSILVVSSLEDIHSTVEFWIERLDQPTSGGKLSTFVYYIQNAEADKLATILNSIFDEGNASKSDSLVKPIAAPTDKDKDNPNSKLQPVKSRDSKKSTASSFTIKGGVKSEFEGDIYIIPDVDTNSLVIRTQPRNYPAILELVQKLDLLPQQVLIEVLILDLTLDEQTLLGLEWALKGTVGNQGINNGDKIVGLGSAPAVSSLGTEIGNTATSLFAPGASFFVQRKDKLIALLQAFASDSKINIVANPILVTSDNKEANIAITDDIPIQSSTITTPTAGQPLTQSTIQFRDVGIKLNILPKINRDNFVNLKIDQEISDQGPVIQDTPSFITRTLKTEVVLKDNEILVMGGLMRTTSSETISGVPFLMDIPLLGKLFSSTDTTAKKTELMLFITPHIISNTDDSRYITDQFQKKLGNLKKKIAPEDRVSDTPSPS